MSDLSQLIERLEAAEVGSQGLDVAVIDAAGLAGKWVRSPTTSLDAAFALKERLLPELTWSIDNHDGDDDGAFVALRRELNTVVISYAKTPALALCIAILLAVQKGGGE